MRILYITFYDIYVIERCNGYTDSYVLTRNNCAICDWTWRFCVVNVGYEPDLATKVFAHNNIKDHVTSDLLVPN